MLRGGRVDDCRTDKAVSLTDNKRVLFYATPRKMKVKGYVPEVGLCFRSEINKKRKSFQRRQNLWMEGVEGMTILQKNNQIQFFTTSKFLGHDKVLSAQA